MRILLLADIHANWPALRAVDETFDACYVVGDLVEYATDPVPCIDWVRANAAVCVRGNHDHAVAQRVPPRYGRGFRGLAAVTRPIHWRLLDDRRLRFLARLPVTQRVRADDRSLYLVHATPRDPLDEYLGPDADGWRMRLKDVEADIVCVGHTHQPFVLELDGKTVVNPGSVGQPRDGDPRAAYAIIEDGRIELRRVEYDVEETLRQLRDSGVTGSEYELAETVLRTGGTGDATPSETISGTT